MADAQHRLDRDHVMKMWIRLKKLSKTFSKDTLKEAALLEKNEENDVYEYNMRYNAIDLLGSSHTDQIIVDHLSTLQF